MHLHDTALQLAPKLSRDTPFVYILRLRSGNFYVGCSTDFEARFGEHEHGTACRTTAIDPPTALLFIETHADFRKARQRESQIKRWSHEKKRALIQGDLRTAALKQVARLNLQKTVEPTLKVHPRRASDQL